MTEHLRRTLRDSAAARWGALFIVSFTMMCGYFLTDIMAPLAGLLEGQLGWSRAEFGNFTSSYGWFNVFLLIPKSFANDLWLYPALSMASTKRHLFTRFPPSQYWVN